MSTVMDNSATDIILLAEDDENDAFLFQAAFRKAGVKGLVTHVPDGKHAIDYLQGTGIYSDRIRHPLPSLLITDLKMPNRTGFDLLAWIKTQARFSQLPTIVLTSSAIESDKQRAMALGASSYLVKPSHLEDFVVLARGVQEDFLHQQA
jgi:CheY-like chemotaxis protein